MAEITTLREAIAGLVRDGDVVAMEGFTHLIPFAAGHEVIRQQRKNLTQFFVGRKSRGRFAAPLAGCRRARLARAA